MHGGERAVQLITAKACAGVAVPNAFHRKPHFPGSHLGAVQSRRGGRHHQSGRTSAVRAGDVVLQLPG